MRTFPLAAALACSLSISPAATAQVCTPDWQPTFGGAAGLGGGHAYAARAFDDGSGLALYVGGGFEVAGGIAVDHVARWNGTTWSPVGAGFGGTAFAFEVFDDGAGPALFAAVGSTVQRWDGSAWTVVSPPFVAGTFRSLQVFDDGSGAALFAGGEYKVGASGPQNLMRWDGATWTDVGFVDAGVFALEVFDDGSGPALYAGGQMTSAGGVPVDLVARWDGSAWSPVGPVSCVSTGVYSLLAYDDGTGPVLVAGGLFGCIGGASIQGLARWDGSVWTSFGYHFYDGVFALAAFDDGGGSSLYVGGNLITAAPSHVMRWDGAAWSSVGGGIAGLSGFLSGDGVYALAAFDDGTGPELFAAGKFTHADGAPVANLASWNGAAWSDVGGGGLYGMVRAACRFDSGSGPELVASGAFDALGGVAGQKVARWTGAGWVPFGDGPGGNAFVLQPFDGGGGEQLHAGGFLPGSSGAPGHVKRWDGAAWSLVGGGVDGAVNALAVFDDGSGAALFAGGSFFHAGGVSTSRIARWDGAAWAPLGAIFNGVDGPVYALCTFDDGTGPALYVGGLFTKAGGVPAQNLARWDGTAWSPVGGGVSGAPRAMTVHDDGSGPALLVAGGFTLAGSTPAKNIVRWDGSAWSALGAGLPSVVLSLTSFDDGSGPVLVAGGQEDAFAFPTPTQPLSSWDGTTWTALGEDLDGDVWSVLALPAWSGSKSALFVGGEFTTSPGADSYAALVQGCTAFAELGGCLPNAASLCPTTPSLSLGGPLELALTAGAIPDGLAVFFAGVVGVDGGGCGPVLPGYGELLLSPAPFPTQLGSAATSGGSASLALTVPNLPTLVGAEVGFQAANAGVSMPGLPIELSTGLKATIAP